MKKIILSISLCSASGLCLFAQDAKLPGNGAAAEKATVKEATINGIPYSQYRAQQEALKAQEVNKQSPQAVVPPQYQINTGVKWDPSTVRQVPVAPVTESNVPDNRVTVPDPKVEPKLEKPVLMTEAARENEPQVPNAPGIPQAESVSQAEVSLAGTSMDKQVSQQTTAEQVEKRSAAEMDASRKAEALQVPKKPVSEENVSRTQISPLLTGASLADKKTAVTPEPEKLKPTPGTGNAPVQEKKD